MKSDAIDRLLQAVRRRIWLEELLDRCRIAIWAGSLGLLAISLFGVFITPVSVSHAAITAAVVFATIMFSAVLLRPGLETCAFRADRVFDNDSLLMTALEVKRMSDVSPAAHVVLQQAGARVPYCNERVGTTWSTPPASGFALAGIPVFAAVLLLAYSNVEDAQATTENQDTGAGTAPEYTLDDADELRELRDSIVRSSTQANNKSGAADDDAERPGAEEHIATSTESSDEGSSSMSVIAEGTGRGREAGDSKGERPSAGQASSDLTFAERSVLQIERRGDAIAGSDGFSNGFDAARGIVALPEVQAASAPASLSAWTMLSPAQIAYASRYLESMENERD